MLFRSDLNATTIDSVGFATFKVTDLNFNNLVPNGNLAALLSNGLPTGWSSSNDSGQPFTPTVELCPQGKCLHLIVNTSRSRVSSPNFSTVKDQWYRVAFDVKTVTDGQPFQVTVRRGGGGDNRFEELVPGAFNFTGTTNFKRYTFTFKATKTINAADPVTLDFGARVDFQNLVVGTDISIGKLEMLPLSPIETALKTRILVNSSAAALDLVCPDQATDFDLCNHFVKFSDNQPITFPYTLLAHSSEVIFSRDATLTDSDGDGVPTSQDDCAATTAGESSNAHGCSFSQSP